MIEFSCGQCGKTFRVPGQYAGKSAKCKSCGHVVTVPQPSAAVEPLTALVPTMPVPAAPVPAAPVPAAPVPTERVPMRTRRLRADAEAMLSAFAGFETIRVTPLAGDPPEVYRVQYQVEGLRRGNDGKPVPQTNHQIEIHLTSEYPRLAPKCKMVTPIFHPNIDPATICVGDHWTAGERLVDLVIRIAEMLAYQAYNIQSPLDGEAAMWADLHRGLLPTDTRDLRPTDWE